jgi:phosphoglycerate dehydrogenase-like enzyme
VPQINAAGLALIEQFEGCELTAYRDAGGIWTIGYGHTPATEGFFHTGKFSLMKKTAFFINIGRGMTTKLDDLVAALTSGQIAGAALDVYEQEPLPASHPLWGLPNVILTPHMAGYGPHLNERRFQIIQDNCRAFAEGRTLRNVVDKTQWF